MTIFCRIVLRVLGHWFANVTEVIRKDKLTGAIQQLTHWGRMTHICVSQLTIIVSDNGLSPDRRQAIIWNNDGKLSFGPLGRNFSEIVIEIYIFSFTKMHLKISSGKWRPSCLGLNVLNTSRERGVGEGVVMAGWDVSIQKWSITSIEILII